MAMLLSNFFYSKLVPSLTFIKGFQLTVVLVPVLAISSPVVILSFINLEEFG